MWGPTTPRSWCGQPSAWKEGDHEKDSLGGRSCLVIATPTAPGRARHLGADDCRCSRPGGGATCPLQRHRRQPRRRRGDRCPGHRSASRGTDDSCGDGRVSQHRHVRRRDGGLVGRHTGPRGQRDTGAPRRDRGDEPASVQRQHRGFEPCLGYQPRERSGFGRRAAQRGGPLCRSFGARRRRLCGVLRHVEQDLQLRPSGQCRARRRQQRVHRLEPDAHRRAATAPDREQHRGRRDLQRHSLHRSHPWPPARPSTSRRSPTRS